MLTNCLKLFASVSVATDAAATIEAPDDCVIQGLQWSVTAALAAVNQNYIGELSFASTNGFTSNDTRASFSTVRLFSGNVATVITAGLAVWNESVTGLLIPCSAGERIYLHIGGTAVASLSTVYLYCIGRTGSRMSDRRRA